MIMNLAFYRFNRQRVLPFRIGGRTDGDVCAQITRFPSQNSSSSRACNGKKKNEASDVYKKPRIIDQLYYTVKEKCFFFSLSLSSVGGSILIAVVAFFFIIDSTHIYRRSSFSTLHTLLEAFRLLFIVFLRLLWLYCPDDESSSYFFSGRTKHSMLGIRPL